MSDHKNIIQDDINQSETSIFPINQDYRFRRHVLHCGGVEVVFWDLQKRRPKGGDDIWIFVATDRSPVRLGLYCRDRGIFPDTANTKLLASLCGA